MVEPSRASEMVKAGVGSSIAGSDGDEGREGGVSLPELELKENSCKLDVVEEAVE